MRPNPCTLYRRDRLAAEAILPDTRKPADRKCLGCGKTFTSRWIGNRMCVACGGVGAKVARVRT